METNAITMEAPSTEHSNPFFMFEVSQVCATCTNHLLTGKRYSLDTLVDQRTNVNLYQVLLSQFQFKCEENGPSNICRECFSKTLLFYEFHQQCKISVKLFDKYVEWQKQFLTPDIVDLGIYDTNAISTNVEEEQDVKPTIDIEETVISKAISTNVEEEQDVKLSIDIEETVISEVISTNVGEERDEKPTIDIEETVISEGTGVNANDDFNSLREVEGVESVISCSNESTKSNVLNKKSKQNNSYECTECDATYNNPKSLLYHRNIHDKKFLCSYCGKPNGSSVRLKLHERLHTGELPFVCGKCGKQFREKCILRRHLVTHTKKRIFKCEICEKTFKTSPLLRHHTQIHKEIKPHKCTECDVSFEQAFLLKRHLHKHEKVADKDENEECLTLASKSSSQDEETNQQTRESNMLEKKYKQDMLYECRKCDASYDLYSSFLKHQNIHKKRFVCSHCDHPCSSQPALRIHERIHTGERPFECGKCGKQFSRKGNLKTHLVTHTRKRIFKCRICEKALKSWAMLQRHTQIHKEIKPHKCTECGVSFEQAFLLKRHVQVHEKVADNDNLYKCTECDATYDLHKSLLQHQNIHKKRFVCSHCGKPWPSPSTLRIHERIHTGERPFVCGKCGKQFSKKGNLKRHLVTHAV